MKILFENSEDKILGVEGRSNLLSRDSDLYKWLSKERKKILDKYGALVSSKLMDFHIEIQKKYEKLSQNEYLSRINALHDKDITLKKNILFNTVYIVTTPYIEGYGTTHIIIAHFKDGLPIELGGIKMTPNPTRKTIMRPVDWNKSMCFKL